MPELTMSVSDITMSQVTELTNPKLLKIAERIAREAELTLEKVAANHTQAVKFPIAAKTGTFEETFKSRFDTLPQAKKQIASAKAIERLNAPVAVRKKHFGDLASVDLSSAQSVDEQIKAIAFPASLKFTAGELAGLTKDQEDAFITAAAAVTNKLELRIHKVKCVDETNGLFGSEAGDDEIDLGGTTVDETGDVKKVTAFRVRSDFDDGEQKVYSPPKPFPFFSLLEGNTFPKKYFVTLILSEADMGGLPDFINKLQSLLRDKVKAAIIAAGLPTGGALGAVIGAVVAHIVSRVFDFIIQIWSDDVFPPVTASVSIPSLSARWNGKTDSPEGIATFSGHGGRYQVTYDWRLFA